MPARVEEERAGACCNRTGPPVLAPVLLLTGLAAAGAVLSFCVVAVDWAATHEEDAAATNATTLRRQMEGFRREAGMERRTRSKQPTGFRGRRRL
jgi:hypothetical protein